MTSPAQSAVQNLLPVQAYFDAQDNFVTFIGQNQPFYATANPNQSGVNITNSTINSTTIGATTPSTGVFTSIATTTGSITTTPSAATDIANKQYVDNLAFAPADWSPNKLRGRPMLALAAAIWAFEGCCHLRFKAADNLHIGHVGFVPSSFWQCLHSL